MTGAPRLAPRELAEAADRFGAGAEPAGAGRQCSESAFAAAAVEAAGKSQSIAGRTGVPRRHGQLVHRGGPWAAEMASGLRARGASGPARRPAAGR